MTDQTATQTAIEEGRLDKIAAFIPCALDMVDMAMSLEVELNNPDHLRVTD